MQNSHEELPPAAMDCGGADLAEWFALLDPREPIEAGDVVELIDGCLVVSPSAGRPHNDTVMQLFRLLDRACPDDVTIYNVPYDYRLPDDSELVPDITVARNLKERGCEAHPMPLSELTNATDDHFNLSAVFSLPSPGLEPNPHPRLEL